MAVRLSALRGISIMLRILVLANLCKQDHDFVFCIVGGHMSLDGVFVKFDFNNVQVLVSVIIINIGQKLQKMFKKGLP
jgi:hypothetical protein